jgi:methylated-DNA-[protein]-cysteine S-methyltransferase
MMKIGADKGNWIISPVQPTAPGGCSKAAAILLYCGMAITRFALFPTDLGTCGIVWREGVIIGLQLPENSDAEARTLLRRRFEAAKESVPEGVAANAIDAIRAHMAGRDARLDDIPLDLGSVAPFARRVYEAARGVPAGSVATYGEIATRIGQPGEARAVGQALGRNPFPIVIPCHRVLGSSGKVGGFSAHGGVATKLRLLTLERARISAEPTLFDGADWPLVSR